MDIIAESFSLNFFLQSSSGFFGHMWSRPFRHMSIVLLLLTFSLRVNTGAAENRVFGGREIGPDSVRLFPHSVELFLHSGGGGGGGGGGRGGGRASHHCGGALIAPK